VQVPVIQVMLGQLGLVTSEMMFKQWRYVVVGATVAAAVLTPSTDPFTQTLLAVPLVSEGPGDFLPGSADGAAFGELLPLHGACHKEQSSTVHINLRHVVWQPLRL